MRCRSNITQVYRVYAYLVDWKKFKNSPFFMHIFIYFFRLSNWEEAQYHCESLNMTLLQYSYENEYATDGTLSSINGRFLFLGLKKNTQVSFLIW